jgi:hypothetical protein
VFLGRHHAVPEADGKETEGDGSNLYKEVVYLHELFSLSLA